VAITLPADVKKRIVKSLHAFVLEHYEQDLGELRMQVLYDFLMGLVAAAAYNQGIADAQAYMQKRLIDMEIELEEKVQSKPSKS